MTLKGLSTRGLLSLFDRIFALAVHIVPARFRSAGDHASMMPEMCVPQSEHFSQWTLDCLVDLLLTWSDVGSTIRCGVISTVLYGCSFRDLFNSRSLVRSCVDQWSKQHVGLQAIAVWARWRLPFFGGRSARHIGGPNFCIFCHAPVGDRHHYVSRMSRFRWRPSSLEPGLQHSHWHGVAELSRP